MAVPLAVRRMIDFGFTREGMSLIDSYFAVMIAVAGVLVGILVGMTGMGGGSLLTPILVIFFGFQPTLAPGVHARHSDTLGVGAQHRCGKFQRDRE